MGIGDIAKELVGSRTLPFFCLQGFHKPFLPSGFVAYGEMLGQTVGERVDCYKIASFEESFAAVVDAYVVEAEVGGEYAAVVG